MAPAWRTRNASHNPAADLLQQSQHGIETGLVHHPNDRNNRFVCEDDVRRFWHQRDFEALLPRWSSNDIRRLCEGYIISFTILVYIGWPIYENGEIFRQLFLNKPARKDAELPFPTDVVQRDLSSLGDAYVKLFLDAQYMFKPCVIECNKRAIVTMMNGNRPWPFLEKPIRVGYGGYGEVYKAPIARGCYRQRTMVNSDSKILAFKKFSDGRNYQKEVEHLTYLRESLISHGHIAVHLAAIVHGEDFFIFLEWTPLGDLEVLFNGGHELNVLDSTINGDFKYDFREQFPEARKEHFVQQLSNIASALEFLHEYLPNNTPYNLYCAHMDLRPKNILIYPRTERGANVGKWVVTDFGISSFSYENPGKPHLNVRTMGDFAYDTSRTKPLRHLQGAHRAPELHELSDRQRYPGRKCDIWSFACIANEVLAFVLGGLGNVEATKAVEALRAFRRRKSLRYFDDSWFEHEDPNSQQTSKAVFRRSVLTWYEDTLTACEPDLINREWVGEFIELLKSTLKIEPEERPKASDIVRSLNMIRDRIATSHGSGRALHQPRSPIDVPVSRTLPTSTISPETPELSISPPGGLGLSSVHLNRSPEMRTAWDGLAHSADSTSSSNRLSHLSSPSIEENMAPLSGGISTSGGGSGGSTRSDASSGLDEKPSPSSLEAPQSPDIPFGSGCQLERSSWQLDFNLNKATVFDLCPTTDRVAFLFHTRQMVMLSVFKLTDMEYSKPEFTFEDLPHSIDWNRISLSSRYVVVTGSDRGNRAGRIFDVNTGKAVAMEEGWPSPCFKITSSAAGDFAWETTASSSRSIMIWNPDTRHTLKKSISGTVDHLCFNASGTCLFIWARDQRTHHAYMIDMTNFASQMDQMPCVKFPRESARLPECFIWPAQGDSACIVQESASQGRFYLNFGVSKTSTKLRLPEISPAGAPIVQSALCDKWLVTARKIRSKPYKSGIQIVKQYFHIDSQGELNIHKVEEITPFLKLKAVDFKLAAYQDDSTEYVVLCSAGGEIRRWKSPRQPIERSSWIPVNTQPQPP